jgi:hypothetical protein
MFSFRESGDGFEVLDGNGSDSVWAAVIVRGLIHVLTQDEGRGAKGENIGGNKVGRESIQTTGE